jgi:hypothetical protein
MKRNEIGRQSFRQSIGAERALLRPQALALFADAAGQHDGPTFANAKTYYPVEDEFPYNDLPEISPIVFDDDIITGSIIYIFPEEPMEMVSLIKNECKISKEFFNRIRNEWVKIGDKEYKISYAFGGERFNLIYREPGQIKDVYPILFTDDWDSFS